jgi:hypothetical protein
MLHGEDSLVHTIATELNDLKISLLRSERKTNLDLGSWNGEEGDVER